MKIIIIGAGSLGSLFGGRLALSGSDISLIVSERSYPFLKNKPFLIQNIDGSRKKIEKIKIFSGNINSLSISDFYDVLIISTKAYSLENVCKEYKMIIERSKMIVLLQNGLGNEEIVRSFYKNIPLYRLITSNGAYIKESPEQTENDKYIVYHTGIGKTILCKDEQNPKTINISKTSNEYDLIEKQLLDVLNKAGFSSYMSNNPKETIWRKAIINIGINVFGALTNLNNGALIEIPELWSLIKKTIEESMNIGKKIGIPFEKDVDYLEIVKDVIIATKINKNSMLQDILKKRRTEIDFLNGKIVKIGRKIGIETPINETLTNLIKAIECSYSF